jgi:hypothetical protein
MFTLIHKFYLFNSDRQAKRVRQDFSVTEDAWNARRQIMRQGLSLRRLGSNGSSVREVEQLLLPQRRERRWQWQMESCNTKKNRNSERDLGRLGLPARTGPEARLLGAGGTSLPSGSRFCRLHGGGGVAVDERSKYLHNAMANRGRKRKNRKNLQEIRSD